MDFLRILEKAATSELFASPGESMVSEGFALPSDMETHRQRYPTTRKYIVNDMLHDVNDIRQHRTTSSRSTKVSFQIFYLLLQIEVVKIGFWAAWDLTEANGPKRAQGDPQGIQ